MWDYWTNYSLKGRPNISGTSVLDLRKPNGRVPALDLVIDDESFVSYF